MSTTVAPPYPCAYCGTSIPRTNIARVCIPCQHKEMKWTANPKNFEGARWHWHATRYVPIQMCYGTPQTHCMEWTAQAAWKAFERITGRTREELKREGYRVKRITITPAWKPTNPANPKSNASANTSTPSSNSRSDPPTTTLA